jgi:4-alpha-glucanotransferase
MQDVLLLGEEARMNVPGVAEGNWAWKMDGPSVTEAYPYAKGVAAWLKELAGKTGR